MYEFSTSLGSRLSPCSTWVQWEPAHRLYRPIQHCWVPMEHMKGTGSAWQPKPPPAALNPTHPGLCCAQHTAKIKQKWAGAPDMCVPDLFFTSPQPHSNGRSTNAPQGRILPSLTAWFRSRPIKSKLLFLILWWSKTMQAVPHRGETNNVRSPSLQWDLLWPFLTVFEPSSKTNCTPPAHTETHFHKQWIPCKPSTLSTCSRKGLFRKWLFKKQHNRNLILLFEGFAKIICPRRKTISESKNMSNWVWRLCSPLPLLEQMWLGNVPLLSSCSSSLGSQQRRAGKQTQRK